MSDRRGPPTPSREEEQLSLAVVTVVLGLTLWLAIGSLVLGLADGGLHPTRRLLVGVVIVVASAAALIVRRTVCAWLRARPWIIMPVAGVQLALAGIDGLLPAGPYVAFSLTSVALAAPLLRPRTVWATVVLLESGYAIAILAVRSPSVIEANLSGVLGTVLGYPCVALVGMALVRLYAGFVAGAEARLEALRSGVPATTPALTRAIERGPAPLRQLPAPPLATLLTPAERRVLQRLVDGSTPKQIAFQDGIALSTVRSHIKHAKRKAGARTLAELVARGAGSNSSTVIADDDTPARSTGRAVAVRRFDRDLVRSGAELVGLSERFFAGLFAAAIVFVGLAALAAWLLLPARPISPGPARTAAFFATGLLVTLTPLALWRSRALYCALRRRPLLRIGLVLIAGALVVDPELSGELWWPSCAILVALAIVTSVRQTVACCLCVLGSNLAGHVIAGDLHETPAVSVIGLWIGYPLWTVTIATLADRLGARVLWLNAHHRAAGGGEPPRRVHARVVEAEVTSPPQYAAGPAGDADPVGEKTRAAGEVERLGSRHLEVVALLADGLRHRDIAACMSISERHVQRLIAQAVERLDAGSVYRLVAVAVSEGIVPAPRGYSDARDPGGG